jgi:hypothetical protein
MPVRPERKKGKSDRSKDVSAKSLAEMSMRLIEAEDNPKAAEFQEQAYWALEKELFDLKQETLRLQALHEGASPQNRERVKDLLSLADEAVSSQQEKIAAFLKKRPWLKKIIREKRAMEKDVLSSHTPEGKWREGLWFEQEQWEKEALGKLRQEQEEREQEWRKKERLRLEEQERRIAEVIGDRLTKLEEEFMWRTEGSAQDRGLSWLQDQQKRIQSELRQELMQIRKDAEKRELAWKEDSQKEFQKREADWREQRRRELQRMEAEWREQEILHRERKYLHSLEEEWKLAQQETLRQLTSEWKRELFQAHGEELGKWLAAQKTAWQETQKQWHTSLSAETHKACGENVQASAQAELEKLQGEWSTKLSRASEEWERSLKSELYAALARSTSEWKKDFEELNSKELKRWITSESKAWQETQKQWQIKLGLDYEQSLSSLGAEMRKACKEDVHKQLLESTSRWLDEQRRASKDVLAETKASIQAQFDQYQSEWSRSINTALQEWAKEWQTAFDATEKRLQAKCAAEEAKRFEEARKTLADCIELHRNAAQKELAQLSETLVRQHQATLEQQGQDWVRRQQERWEKQRQQAKEELSQEVKSIRQADQNERSRYWQEAAEKLEQQEQGITKKVLVEIDRHMSDARELLNRHMNSGLEERFHALRREISELRKELLNQHQMEIELIGQELRRDLQTSLGTASEELYTVHRETVGTISDQYEQRFGVELALAIDRMRQLQEEKYIENLDNFRGDAMSSLQNHMAKALSDMSKTHEDTTSNKLAELSQRFSRGYECQLESVTAELKEKLWIDMDKAVAVLISDVSKKLEDRHEKRCQVLQEEYVESHKAELASQRLSLEEQFKKGLQQELTSILAQIETRLEAGRDLMVAEHKQQLEELRKELYMEYRNRLGKLVEEIHRSSQPASDKANVQTTRVEKHKRGR